MIPENAIRLRSYLIWLEAGCPDGKAIEHWLRAKSELEAEYLATPLGFDCECNVMPRPAILRPPQRMTSARIPTAEREMAPIAATQ